MLKVLIIDKSVLIRDRLIRMIDEIPGILPIYQADSNEQAKYYMNEINPDIIVIDQINEDKGEDLISYMKNRDKDNIIIVSTNNINSLYRSKCLKSGANYFIDKSTEFELMLSLLKNIAEDPYSFKTRFNCTEVTV